VVVRRACCEAPESLDVFSGRLFVHLIINVMPDAHLVKREQL
jgi:hypothetical protein